jgi:hypothetical protein
MRRYTYGDICTSDESSPRRAVRCLDDSHALSNNCFFVGLLGLRTATLPPGAAAAES